MEEKEYTYNLLKLENKVNLNEEKLKSVENKVNGLEKNIDEKLNKIEDKLKENNNYIEQKLNKIEDKIDEFFSQQNQNKGFLKAASFFGTGIILLATLFSWLIDKWELIKNGLFK